MTEEIIEGLDEFLQRREEVQFALLFGSLARSTANKLSDIDIAVQLYRIHEEACRQRWSRLK